MSWLLEFPRPWLSVERLLRMLEPASGERLLELGPGTGVYTLPVARAIAPTGQVEAIDIQQEMLDALARRAHLHGLDNIRPRCGTAPALPYDDASFDGAFLVTVLHEIPDQNAALGELARVVKPDGRIVIGELAPLPTTHFISLPRLQVHAESAGLRFQRRLGPRLAFYARLSSEHSGQRPATSPDRATRHV